MKRGTKQLLCPSEIVKLVTTHMTCDTITKVKTALRSIKREGWNGRCKKLNKGGWEVWVEK
jgi:hypothetical protein